MSLFRDIQERCDLLLERYVDYNKSSAAQTKESGSLLKEFDELRRFLELRVAQLHQEADSMAEGHVSSGGKSAVQNALQNARLRRGKQEAMDAFMELQVIVSKGKKITKATIQNRVEELDNLYQGILDIPDGIRGRNKIYNMANHGGGALLDMGDISKEVLVSGVRASSNLNTPEASLFRDAWERAKRKHNEKLDVIALGLDKIQDLGYSMGDELDRQDGFLQGVEDRVDTVDQDLKKETKQIGGDRETTTNEVSSVSRFCCISFLVFVILALLGYLIHFL